MKFISTPYDIDSLKFLIKLKCDFIKIASSELVNLPLLDIARKSNIPIILSTGMSTLKKLNNQSILFFKKKKLTVMKCTSNYPASYKTLNLKSLKIQNEFRDLNLGRSFWYNAAITITVLCY